MEANGNRIATFCQILQMSCKCLTSSGQFRLEEPRCEGPLPPVYRSPDSADSADLEIWKLANSIALTNSIMIIMIPSWSMQVLICSFISGTISCSKIFSTHGCSHRSHRSHAMSDLRSRHLPSQQGIYIICWIALAAATVTDLGVQYTCSIIRICSYTLVPYCELWWLFHVIAT